MNKEVRVGEKTTNSERRTILRNLPTLTIKIGNPHKHHPKNSTFCPVSQGWWVFEAAALSPLVMWDNKAISLHPREEAEFYDDCTFLHQIPSDTSFSSTTKLAWAWRAC